MERKCIRCNINIIDNAVECPLCHGVLEIEHEAENSKEHKVPGTETLVSEADEEDHKDRHEGVKVVRDCRQEDVEAVLLADFAGDGDRPARHRGDDAHRSCRGVDDVGQLFS